MRQASAWPRPLGALTVLVARVLINWRLAKEKWGKRVSLDEYYRRLELPDTASPADVKRAYRRLRAKYHPDRNKGREATVEPVFKRIQEAFEILIGERKAPMAVPASDASSGPMPSSAQC